MLRQACSSSSSSDKKHALCLPPPAAADDEEEEDEEEEGKAETAGEDIDSSISASKKDVTFRPVPATAKTLIEEAS